MEKLALLDFEKLNSKEKSINSNIDQELILKDLEEFEQLRQEVQDEIHILNKRIKHKRDIKIIKREAMKNMIEGPPINTETFLTFA